MSWARVDDDFFGHPKTSALTDRAVALWLRGLCHACRHLTDGYLAPHIIAEWRQYDAETAAELVAANCWRAEGDGYAIVDFADYQFTKAEIEARSEAGKKAARARWSANRNANRNATPNAHPLPSQRERPYAAKAAKKDSPEPPVPAWDRPDYDVAEPPDPSIRDSVRKACS